MPFLIGTRDSVQVNRASAIALDLTSFGELLRECAGHAHAGRRMDITWVARVARWVLNRIGWLARSQGDTTLAHNRLEKSANSPEN